MRATPSHRRPRLFRLLAVAAAIVVAIPAATGIVSAAPEKTYALSINPVTLVAGQTYGGNANPQLTITITNSSPQPQQLGSMNLTVPAGITVTSASASQGTAAVAGTVPQVIELRNLSLPQGGVMSVALGADVECSSASAPYVWGSHGKQSNDFNGTGNDLSPSSDPLTNVVSGTCRLVFTGQPADAVTNTIVRTGVFDTSADPVAVSVATGDTSVVDVVTWGSWTITLSETGPGSFATGSVVIATTAGGTGVARTATFAPKLDAPGSYTFTGTTGTADVLNGAASNAFVVVDVAVACPATGPCSSGSQSANRSNVEVSTGNSNAGYATVSFNPPGTEDLCGTGTSGSDVFDVNITNSTAFKTVRITIEKAFVTKAANKYQVCVRLGGVDQFLPDCTSATGPAPCVLSRATVKGAVEVVFLLPPGDPPGKLS